MCADCPRSISTRTAPVSLSLPTFSQATCATTPSPPPPTDPGKADLLACLPKDLLEFHPVKAWGSLLMSLSLSLVAYGLGTQIPLTATAAPLWLL